jgi:hypothetical protein
MLFYVHGLDADNVGADLLELSEAHWSYIDAFADRLVLRGPTLSDDGTAHTGSLHVLELPDRAAAERFAFEEPYWLAGLYRDVTITRAAPLLERTTSDRTALSVARPSSLVLGRWNPVPCVASVIEQEAARLAHDDRLVFCSLLVDDVGVYSLGIVCAMYAAPAEALRLLQPIAETAAGGPAHLIAQRWRRGGRSQDRIDEATF